MDFDEIHEFEDFKLINVIKRPMKKRRQPLIIYITTLGSQLNGPLVQIYELAAQILETPEAIKESVRDRFFAYICEIDENDDPDDTNCWIKANPSLGELLRIEDLVEDWERAKLIPSEKNDFVNKQLNVFTQADEMGFISEELLRRNNRVIDPDMLLGRTCYAGFDASVTEDFTAANLEFPLGDGAF